MVVVLSIIIQMSKSIERHILQEYKVLQLMGSGAYGHVWKVQQRQTHRLFALKKIFDAFRNRIDAQRTYRQIEVLRQLNHPNVIRLLRVIPASNRKDIYLLFEFMEADLHSLVGSKILSRQHQAYVFYQILKAVRFIHSAQLIHRDLKPSNVLIDSDCRVRLCDFGLVRSLAVADNEELILSEEVATKWYRAPQLLLGSRSYSKPVDLWSVGCIMAELLTGKPLFAGNSTLHQLQKILQFTGPLSKEDLHSLESPVADCLVSQIKVKKKTFQEYFSLVSSQFYPLLEGLLVLNPQKRLTTQEALEMKVFTQFQGEGLGALCGNAIVPTANDNVRFNVKFYRENIFAYIRGNSKKKLSGPMPSKANSKPKLISKDKDFVKIKSNSHPKPPFYNQKNIINKCSKQFKVIRKSSSLTSIKPNRIMSPDSKAPLQRMQLNNQLSNKIENKMSPQQILRQFYKSTVDKSTGKLKKIQKRRMQNVYQQSNIKKRGK